MMSKTLDDYQKAAIYFPPSKSVIVEAPPGHGKTFVMARRIEFILQSGYIHPPQKVLGLTFTNAAAGEMLDDIRSNLSLEQQSFVKVMTFHSVCYKVLRAYGNVIGIDRDFLIVGELQQQKFLKSTISRITNQPEDSDFVKRVLEAYGEWIIETVLKKNSQYAHPWHQKLINLVDIEYKNILGANQVDYNYLLLNTIKLFNTNPNILDYYRGTFRYILVDEFQDTNPLQFQLLSYLVFGDTGDTSFLPEAPVFILTDREQAIFRFQGATPENIEKAKKAFNSTELSLLINYRSNCPKIIALTQKIRREPNVPTIEKVDFTISQTPKEEAQLIINRINEYSGPKHDICVIAQSSYYLSDLRCALEDHSIPFVFVPDFKAKSVELKYGSIFEAIRKLADETNSTEKLTLRIRKIFQDENPSWQNDDVLSALIDLATKFEQSVSGKSLSEKTRLFYNDILIEINWGNLLRKRVRNKVFLSTIHGVKGLQFAHVHLCGLVNFVHIHSSICYPCNFGNNFDSIKNSLVEPYNTFYVGVSRAQDELYLYAVKKSSNNKCRTPICILTDFRDYINFPQNVTFCR